MRDILLKIFSDKDPKARKLIIATIDQKTVKEIRRLIYNILRERIRITDKEKNLLKPYSKFMISLTSVSNDKAVKIIKKQGFIILPKFKNILSQVIYDHYNA